MKPSQNFYKPTFPEFVVEFAPGDFRSGLKSLKAINGADVQKVFEAGEIMAYLGRERVTVGPKAYTSVQCGKDPNDHIELNSDLVYINHSCEPSIAFNLSSPDVSKWNIQALRRIKVGEMLTFFYPSTEWSMDQPFECVCGTPSCLRTIQGAKYLSKQDLQARGYVSPWIIELVTERDGVSSSVMSRL
ncbi:hypothetical protein BDQ17DRAFT_1391700 [Cyathus striatus]|nr:hypothetical protein BDQ17DRAFT_1391700 [Cyathus striatus]